MSNPDLVEGFTNEWPITKPLFEYYYTPGPRGYTDYKTYAERKTKNYDMKVRRFK